MAKKEDEEKGRIVVEQLVERIMLKLYRIGCEDKNFHLLKKLPMTATEIEKELGLSPMPTNRRIKELMEVGLIKKEKHGGEIKPTPLAKDFIDNINSLRNDVVQNMAQMI